MSKDNSSRCINSSIKFSSDFIIAYPGETEEDFNLTYNLIKEITIESNITTIVNTHDMNSVMEIGQKIIFLVNGRKIWEGTKEEIFDTGNESVDNFVYSSELFKKVKDIQKKRK